MSDRELNVHSALGRITSSSATERKDGLADLEHIFKHNRNSVILEKVKDKTWHIIYEAIFQCTTVERSNYLKSSHSQKTRTTGATRLTACGRALRITVSAGIRRIRTKTVKALLDHILQTLPSPEGDYCEGLSHDYVKCLAIISEYQPHVEHLRDTWHNVVDFCIEGVGLLQDQPSEPTPGSHSNGVSSLLRTPTVSMARRSRAGSPQPARSQRSSMFRRELDDLIACIHHLTRATNAPIPEKAGTILTALVQYLRVSDTVRLAHHAAFAAINSVFSRIATSSINIVQSTMLDLYPLIKDLWPSKSASLKDEMLVTLILTRNHVSSVLSQPIGATFVLDIENLLETLQGDYSKRLERDQLQFNEVRLICRPNTEPPSFLELCTLRLRGNTRSESNWTILHLMAYYLYLLDARTSKFDQRSALNGDEDVRKRRRRSLLFDDVLRQASVGPTSSQISALQTLPFLAYFGPLSQDQIKEIIKILSPVASDQNGPLASWAAVAIASCAFQKSARDTGLSVVWVDLFHLIARKLATASSCRAASHLLDVLLKLEVVNYSAVAIVVETILSSIELHGPALLSDSSTSLWITLMKAKASENPSASVGISERLIRWVFGKWTPSNFESRGYAAETAVNCHPVDILSVLDVCSDREMAVSANPLFSCHGSIAQTWQRIAESSALTEYLLLNTEGQGFLQFVPATQQSLDSPGFRVVRPSLAADMQILDSCYSETERVLAKWSEWIVERAQNLLPEMMVTVASLCIVNDILVSRQEERNKHRVDALRKVNETLTKSFTAFLALPECDQDNIDAILALIVDYLPSVRRLQSADNSQDAGGSIMPFTLHLSRALDLRRAARKSLMNTNDDELMDIDYGFDSEVSENKNSNAHEISARDLVTMGSDIASFRSCVAAYMQLMSAVFQTTVESINGGVDRLPSPFVQYLISLASSEFCACRPMLRLLLSSQFVFLAIDLDTLFDHLASEFLEVYDFERHEVALSIELDLLQGCANQWTDVDAELLKESATEAYHWFINIALAKNLCSPNVQLGIADLFFTLLRARGPDFKPDPTLPSVRTGLFGLLGSGEIRIKYHISEHIAQFFSHFTLGEHEAVFEDVHKSLPETVTWKEGMALRLLVLSRLASQWNTLLRRCVYHIYETAGMVEQCSGHATFCVAAIAKSLRLDSSQELFKLFASQLLFTWLGLRSVDEIPYSIFSYSSLGSLLSDIQGEVFSQILMRSKDGDITALSVKLESSTSDLLKKNFGKAAAYCLAWDTNKSSSQGRQSLSETKLRALVDKTEYGNLCREHLSSILGTFLYTIDEEHQMPKILSKRPNAAQEFKALKDMQEISASSQTLPADQQPLFRSKFLLDRIDRLARRVNIDPSVLWTPAVYVFVLRMMLSKIHSALGSLHACSVVRKIRILVALSGTVAFSGYPLEMTLHGLRPLLTDKQCADDALGIVQYLFSNGITYLSSQISFVSGVVVSTLISLRQFVGSSQESTTQESQHRATMTRAHNFHKWLVDSWMVDYAKRYEKSDSTLHTCIALVKAASKANAKANPMSGTAESEVLLQLLTDRQSGRKILKGPAWDLAFNLLCSEFAVSPSYRNDILGNDTQATAFAAEVWASCKYPNVSREYLLWAARVLGRAHNAAGLTSTFISARNDADQSESNIESMRESSKSVVLQSLSDLLLSSERNDVGLAEETIRAVLLRTTVREEIAENSELLADSTVLALTLMTTDSAVPISTLINPPLERCIMDVARPVSEWLQFLTVSLSSAAQDDPLVGALPRILAGVKNLAEILFAPILHLVLDRDHHGQQKVRQIISDGCRELLKCTDNSALPHVQFILNAVLYLHKQPFPQEATCKDRLRWLDIDYAVAARAAEKCAMHTTALRFAEQSAILATKTSRRSSVSIPVSIPDDLLLSIFKSIDEPDSFYGVQQTPDLSSVLGRLEYEADGFKGLLFRGARLDSQMRRHDDPSAIDTRGLIRSLINLNLNALPHALLSNQHAFTGGVNMTDSVLYTARKLEQWDIRAPDTTASESSTIFKVFQGINNSRDLGAVRHRLDSGFFGTIKTLLSPVHTGQSMKSCLRTLGILAEVDDVMTSISPDHLRDAWSNMQARSEIMLSAGREDVSAVLSSRETLFSTLSHNDNLRHTMHLGLKDVRNIEVEALLSSCTIARKHSSLRDSLATATYLSDLSPLCSQIGLDIEAAAQNEVADALWDQGEHATSIRMLRRLTEQPRSKHESNQFHRSRLLAKLGHRVAEARLEQPDQIMREYLEPAIIELKGQTKGLVAGQVHHQFASFCDDQLRNPDLNADFDRIQRMRETRKKELEHWEQVGKSMKTGAAKDKVRHAYRKQRDWYRLDNKEYERLCRARESFMTQSLENYLLALSASDSHDNDVLRFFSLWLEFVDSELANSSVGKHLDKVPSAKFVRLMNQLSSRLQNEDTAFQKLLSKLVLRIATEHPFHAMHHIAAGTMSIGVKEGSTKSRMVATKNIAASLKASEKVTSAFWHNIAATDHMYHSLATLHDGKKDDSIFKAGRELKLDDFSQGRSLTTKIKDFRLPPPTMNIPIRQDMDYRNVPRVIGFKPKMRIANGLSAPKIVISTCSDGQSFKQLFKGGNDDLRQDAIMEQVFEEVSKLLRNHTATRQRDLQIRTYKVLPLSSVSGIMEFVQNTKAFHDVLIPLHERYFPKDVRTHHIRTKVHNAQQNGETNEARIKIFRDNTDHFHPAMRYFFLENYTDPDEWFQKRIAYTRSTAAISILGHVVGLGDRHLHNILLDENSGEVVHIDLGVAFEAGRILPIPEIVPFRLSRDVVDGMGYTKTEGVFRRCCEFTLDALREEREAIMTLLNVLRYDPLYSWTVSPLKAKQLQESDDERGQMMDDISNQSSKGGDDDGGEAGRALTIVEKKLSKTLSTAATVSELISQATNERNLALLFSGWAAWV